MCEKTHIFKHNIFFSKKKKKPQKHQFGLQEPFYKDFIFILQGEVRNFSDVEKFVLYLKLPTGDTSSEDLRR